MQAAIPAASAPLSTQAQYLSPVPQLGPGRRWSDSCGWSLGGDPGELHSYFEVWEELEPKQLQRRTMSYGLCDADFSGYAGSLTW